MKIVTYIVITFILLFISFKVLTFLTFLLTDFGKVFDGFMGFLGKIFSVFAPLLIAIVIAFFLDPVVDFFQKYWEVFCKTSFAQSVSEKRNKIFKKKAEKEVDKNAVVYETRRAGTLITFVVVISVIALIVKVILSSIFDSVPNAAPTTESADVSQNMVLLWENVIRKFDDYYKNLNGVFEKMGLSAYFDMAVTKAAEFLRNYLTVIRDFLFAFVGQIASITSSLISLVMSFVLSYYLLAEKEQFKHNTTAFMDIFMPEKLNNGIKNAFGDIHAVFSGYVRGTLTDATIMALLLSIGLSIIGVPFAVLISLISGYSNIIPYLGALVGFVLAVVSALMTGDMQVVVWAIIWVITVQQIDTLVVVPKIVGSSVELSPFLVLLSLSVGGTLFGMAGMIFAVPVTAIFKIFFTRFVERQKENSKFKQNIKKLAKIEIVKEED